MAGRWPHFPARARERRAALRAALDIALPPLCAVCREPVEGEGSVRPAGRSSPSSRRPYCERLGIPFVYDPGPGILSMEAIADPPAYHRARAAVRYRRISRGAGACPQIWRPARPRADDGPLDGASRPRALGRGRRARAGAAALAAAVGAALQPVGHARRAVSKASGVPVAASALKRVKATAQQVGLSRTERAANIQGAFRVPRDGKAEVVGRRLDSGRRRADVRGDGRRLRPGAAAGRCRGTWTCWCSPGLPRQAEHPYKELINLGKS